MTKTKYNKHMRIIFCA